MDLTKLYTFDDVLIVPRFSEIKSRKDVDISSISENLPKLSLPVLSANMDTITSSTMALAMAKSGGAGVLHRFCDIDTNVKMLKESLGANPWVSIGLGPNELERAEALVAYGAKVLVIDVANGANMEVVKQYQALSEKFGDTIQIVVGNFATHDSISTFNDHCDTYPNAFKIGIGPGSACTTRIKTGVGYPQLSAIYECASESDGDYAIIADGGLRTPGDICKAIAAGADMVMLGGMLAGTEETPGNKVNKLDTGPDVFYKQYRGSASKESYEAQGKDSGWRTAEGESFTVPYKGPVENVLKDIEGGLRSSFSYVDANNMEEYRDNTEFVEVSSATQKENGAHGKQ